MAHPDDNPYTHGITQGMSGTLRSLDPTTGPNEPGREYIETPIVKSNELLIALDLSEIEEIIKQAPTPWFQDPLGVVHCATGQRIQDIADSGGRADFGGAIMRIVNQIGRQVAPVIVREFNPRQEE